LVMTTGELGGFAPVGTVCHTTLCGATVSESTKLMVVPDLTLSVAGVKLSAVLLPTPCGMFTVAVLGVEAVEVLVAVLAVVVVVEVEGLVLVEVAVVEVVAVVDPLVVVVVEVLGLDEVLEAELLDNVVAELVESVVVVVVWELYTAVSVTVVLVLLPGMVTG
jgi:hypothetical protein